MKCFEIVPAKDVVLIVGGVKYGSELKQSVPSKVLPPESRAVTEVGKATGIAGQTIMNWMERARNGTLQPDNGEIAPFVRPASEKLKLLIEGKRIQPEKLSERQNRTVQLSWRTKTTYSGRNSRT